MEQGGGGLKNKQNKNLHVFMCRVLHSSAPWPWDTLCKVVMTIPEDK